MGWLILVGYGLGYAWCFRFVVGEILGDFGGPSGVDLEEVVMAVVLGLLMTIFWPVLVAGRLVQRWYYARDERSLGFFRAPVPIESPRDRTRRLERERDDRERYIAELESKLGIGAK
jgi:hypothetical protein